MPSMFLPGGYKRSRFKTFVFEVGTQIFAKGERTALTWPLSMEAVEADKGAFVEPSEVAGKREKLDELEQGVRLLVIPTGTG